MNQSLSIAICQMKVENSKEENLKKAGEMVRTAAGNDAELIVLPEVFNSPYQSDLFPLYAESYPGPSTLFLSQLARENKVCIVGGSIIEKDSEDKLYNTSYVFDPAGKLIGKHRKMHLFDVNMPGKISFFESDTLNPGNQLTLVRFKSITFGLLICYDIRFPELSRTLVLEGADLLVVPAAFNMTSGPLFWELMMRARAVDQQVHLLAAAPARNLKASYHAWGHSLVVNPWGQILHQADETEQILYAHLDFSVNEQVRREVPVLQHRRHDIYQIQYPEPVRISVDSDKLEGAEK